MSEHDSRVRVDRVDWPAVLPWLALFRTVRMALHPAKLLVGLLLVALLYFGGLAMDVVRGPAVPRGEARGEVWGWREMGGEIRTYAALQSGVGGEEMVRGDGLQVGVFAWALTEQRRGFRAMVRSAARLDLGVGDLLAGRGLESRGVAGALGHMFVAVPGYLVRWHPVFLLIYLAWAFVVTAILGGAIARLAAQHACLDKRGSLVEALRFVGRRYPWFFLTPLIPTVLVAIIALVLMVVGLGFNVPGLDVLAALLYGVLLVGGVVAALLVVGLATGGHLLMPSLAVEGTDAFDAVSRAYNYVFGRPWRYLFYSVVSLVYGAVAYLALSLLVFLALWLTWTLAGQWVFAEAGETGVSRFAMMVGEPSPVSLLAPAGVEELEAAGAVGAVGAVGVMGGVASIVARGWTYLLVALLPAFAVSFYFCANTWIYLLLRRAADGTEMDDMFIEARPEEDVPPEKLEPAESRMG